MKHIPHFAIKFASPELQQQLARHPNWLVRMGVAQKTIDRKLLAALQHDGNLMVVCSAENRLWALDHFTYSEISA